VIPLRTIIACSITGCLLTGSLSAQSGPVEITNRGEIRIDQSSESVHFEDDVIVHQAPFYLKTDKILWQKGIDKLLASGNVALFLDPTEHQEGDPQPFMFESLITDRENPQRVEILRADALTFDTVSKTIQPTGTANIQFGFARLIGEDFNLDLVNETVHTGNYRVGFSNLFLEGEALYAEKDRMVADQAHFFIGEPEKLSIQGHARKIEKQGEDVITLKGVKLQIGPVPFFYWPYYQHHLSRQVYSVSGGAGYSGDIGSYIELRPTYHPNDQFKGFADFNFYSERGVLIGPGFNLTTDLASGQHLETKLETGYIRDNGNLGFDILGEPIDGERHFLDFEYLHRFPQSVQVLSRVERWSDSEILRDFATGKFRSIQQPQTFVEVDGVWGPFALTLAAHIRHEAFEYAIERSPELEFRLLPTPISHSGFYHSADIAGSRMRNSDPDLDEDLEQNRFRAYYQLFYPVAVTHWLDFTPQATVQRLNYTDSGDADTDFGFTHLELGFDLTAHTYGEWKLENKIWDLQGLRHILKPTVQFRRVERYGSEQQHALPIEAQIFRTGVDDIDLTAGTFLDEIDSYSLIRIGLLNSLVAKRQEGSVREWIDFDLYHDLYLPEDPFLPNTSMLAANLNLRPAYWLKLDLQSRFNTDPFELNDLFARLRLIDGDIWDLDVSTQFIRSGLQQYLMDFRYKVFENIRFVSSIGFDSRRSLFYEQTYGFQFGIANYWDLFISVNLRQGSTRNNETRFELKIKSARF